MKVFISHSYLDAPELAQELIEALEAAGHEVFYPPSMVHGESIVDSISTAIRMANVVIALLTTHNPNVYFEVGLAAGAHVPTLIAAKNLDDVVLDLSSVPYVQLTDDVGSDANEILRRVDEVADPREKTEIHFQGTAEATLAHLAQNPSELESLPPQEFERLVAELLRDRGLPVHTDSHSFDRGFDILLEGDPLTVVEVKRYSRGNLVSVGMVRQLLGAMTAAGAERGILISSSGFTSSAKAAASEWPIDLMTLEDLLPSPAAEAESHPDYSVE